MIAQNGSGSSYQRAFRRHALSVKELVEQTCQQGDLYTVVDGRATAEEGLAGQQHLQRNEPGDYECEVSFAREFALEGLRLQLRGRADGRHLGCSPPRLDEIKTSRASPELLEAKRGHLHWAQLYIYGALQALLRPADRQFELRLRYVHPDTLNEHCSVRVESRDALLKFLSDALQQFGMALAALWRRRAARDQALQTFAFPLPQFRPNQRVLAARVFQAVAAGESLLLQASTGIGKSIGVLYPAVRTFGVGQAQRFFYLTARRTGALAAVRAMEQLNSAGAPVRWVQIQSKTQLCRISGTPCVPTECPMALGYYDRVPAALAALQAEQGLSPAVIGQVAQRHQVCPFELSLDAARSADVLIGDYNYVFDPDVRLQRFAQASDIGLLVDEAHQLVPRSLGMLSADIDQRLLTAARTQASSGPLRKRLDSVQRAVSGLAGRAAKAQALDAGPLDRAVERLLAECASLDWHTELVGAVQEFLWSASRWQKRAVLLSEIPSVMQVEQPQSRHYRQVRNECLDSAPYLQKLFASYAGDVRFSGTLQPPQLYQRLQGRLETQQASIASPYRAEQLAVCVVRDVPTYYRSREASLPQLAELVRATVTVHAGTYLVALPSFAYLQQLQDALVLHLASDTRLHAQERGMTEEEQTTFLEHIAALGGTQVVLVVLGGVFAESVDFTGIALAGVLCVGVGLAPPSVLRRAQQQHFDDAGEDGALVAYTQPAMVKIVQMAGRLLRDPTDRGVVLLIDDRYLQARYAQFFPDYWHPTPVSSAAVTNLLENFWSEP